MKEKDDIRIDFKLWDLVKSSTKKIKSNDCISHFPKKTFFKKEVPKSFHTINKTEKKINLDKTSKTSNKLNFIDNSNTGGIRNKDLKKLKSGKFTIQSKLDLHGFKLIDAEKMFYDFIHRNFEQSNRNLLIITGKGHQGKGKIRKDIHTWINKSSLLRIIIFYSYASPKDGGEGALYIRLRKNI
mgnify:FL=1